MERSHCQRLQVWVRWTQHTVAGNAAGMSQAALKKFEIFPESFSYMSHLKDDKNCGKNLGITIFSFSSKYYKNQKETKQIVDQNAEWIKS